MIVDKVLMMVIFYFNVWLINRKGLVFFFLFVFFGIIGFVFNDLGIFSKWSLYYDIWLVYY